MEDNEGTNRRSLVELRYREGVRQAYFSSSEVIHKIKSEKEELFVRKFDELDSSRSGIEASFLRVCGDHSQTYSNLFEMQAVLFRGEIAEEIYTVLEDRFTQIIIDQVGESSSWYDDHLEKILATLPTCPDLGGCICDIREEYISETLLEDLVKVILGQLVVEYLSELAAMISRECNFWGVPISRFRMTVGESTREESELDMEVWREAFDV